MRDGLEGLVCLQDRIFDGQDAICVDVGLVELQEDPRDPDKEKADRHRAQKWGETADPFFLPVLRVNVETRARNEKKARGTGDADDPNAGADEGEVEDAEGMLCNRVPLLCFHRECFRLSSRTICARHFSSS